MSLNRILTLLTRVLLLAGLFSGALSAAPLPPTVTPGLNSLKWELTNTGGSATAFTGICDGSSIDGLAISGATSANGATDAFDNAWMLFVDDTVFVAPDSVDLNGELFTAGTVRLSGLDISLEILFSGSLQAARIRALFTNPTDAAIPVDVDVPINLGSDDVTVFEEASINDNVFTTADRWIVTSDNNLGINAVNTTVIFGPGTPTVTPRDVTLTVCNDAKNNDKGIGFSFSITVPANATRSLMFFAGLGDIKGTNNTITGAIANAAMFNSNTSIDIRLLDDLSATEQKEILNWDFSTTINTAATAAEDDEDRTFIDDFFGCSLGKHSTKDPLLPLLVAFAIVGLVRKRHHRENNPLLRTIQHL